VKCHQWRPQGVGPGHLAGAEAPRSIGANRC